MQSERPSNSKDLTRHTGDRHSIPRQVIGCILSALRETSEMQTMVRRYRQF